MKRFPVGIFFLLFIVECFISTAACTAYFLYAGRSRIEEMESYTRSYSISIADAFSNVAEIGYRTKKKSYIKSLFREKIGENIIDEAFFVLKNGKIIAHTSREKAKDLRWNIASDEFSYNLDLILKPVTSKSREVMFTDYNVISLPVSFERHERMLLKRFLYPKIDVTGWLVSKAVFVKKKPVGTVGFIIGKGRIYSFLKAHMYDSIRFLIASLAISFFISLVVSLVVLARYRGIQKKMIRHLAGGAAPQAFAQTREPAGGSSEFFDMTIDDHHERMPGSRSGDNAAAGTGSHSPGQDASLNLNRPIKDAIRVSDEE
jgi:hypothetical protein